MENIRVKITKLRQSKGLSIRKLSKIIGITDTGLQKIESGFTKSISIETGKKLAKALDISFAELFEIDTLQPKQKSSVCHQHLRPEISPESVISIKVIYDDFIRAQMEFEHWTKSFDDLVVEIISITQRFDGPRLSISIIYWIP